MLWFTITFDLLAHNFSLFPLLSGKMKCTTLKENKTFLWPIFDLSRIAKTSPGRENNLSAIESILRNQF
jgi:hypothetical protein